MISGRKEGVVFILYCFFLIGISSSYSQHIYPLAYWTFDRTEEKGNSDFSSDFTLYPYPNSNASIPNLRGNGKVGNYVFFEQGISPLVSNKPIGTGSKANTIEFLGKINSLTNTFEVHGPGINLFINYNLIALRTVFRRGDELEVANFSIPLRSADRSSIFYYYDHDWHHFVISVDFEIGEMKMWVDGMSPEGFTFQHDFPPNAFSRYGNGINQVILSGISENRRMLGAIDEFAIYDQVLPSELVVRHYLESKAGKHYSFDYNSDSSDPLALPQINLEIDSTEFAPGHPNPTITSLEQLQMFPLPRYRKGHSMLRNFDWIPYKHFGVERKDVPENYTAIIGELATNWNYYMLLPFFKPVPLDKYEDTTDIGGKVISYANKHPELPVCLILHWGQITPSMVNFRRSSPYVYSQDFPDNYYLRDENGNVLLDRSGRKRVSPLSPVDSLMIDGITVRKYLENYFKYLKRPIQFINENGEIIGSLTNKRDPGILLSDPDVADHYEKSGLDWYTYDGRYNRHRLDSIYKSQFIDMEELEETHFSYYYIDGHEFQSVTNNTKFKYAEARKILSTINGQKYSTPSFYPRKPFNWRIWSGHNSGLKWVCLGREVEIALGDTYFSPFISPGSGIDPEQNIRPAQWLGLLKLLGMLGAEFYYTGHFNVLANQKNYIWQAVLPSYSQAIFSHQESFFKNSDLIEPAKFPNRPDLDIPYVFITDDIFNKPLIARKHREKKWYLITSSIQPSSNYKGNAPIESETHFTLDGRNLTIPCRRQGSIYFLDLENPSKPVFFQMDSWHENTHPYYWSSDFRFEIEEQGEYGKHTIQTEFISSVEKGDLTEYNTYISLGAANKSQECSLVWHPREVENEEMYRVKVRARLSSNTDERYVDIHAHLDSQFLAKSKISSQDWAWYTLRCPDELFEIGPKEHVLVLGTSSGNIELDKVWIEKVNPDTIKSHRSTFSYTAEGKFDTTGIFFSPCIEIEDSEYSIGYFDKNFSGVKVRNVNYLESVGDAMLIAHREYEEAFYSRSQQKVIKQRLRDSDKLIERWTREWHMEFFNRGVQGGIIQIIFRFGDYGLNVLPRGSSYLLIGKDSVWNSITSNYKIKDDELIFTLPTTLLSDYRSFTLASNDTDVSPFFESIKTAVPINIESVHLSGNMKLNKAILKWEVNGNQAADQYVIEKSIDGIRFREIGIHEGKKAKFPLDFFQYVDEFPQHIQHPSYYYRVIGVWNDTLSIQSNRIRIQSRNFVDRPFIIRAFPNPARDRVSIKYLTHIKNTKLEILNGTGKILYSTVVDSSSEESEIEVPVSGWHRGIYYAKLSNEKMTSVYKIVVE